MELFKKNYTKWLPFGNYKHAYTEYIVFVKKNLKTGMMKFKSVKANPSTYHDCYIPGDLIDVREQWELIKQLN